MNYEKMNEGETLEVTVTRSHQQWIIVISVRGAHQQLSMYG